MATGSALCAGFSLLFAGYSRTSGRWASVPRFFFLKPAKRTDRHKPLMLL